MRALLIEFELGTGMIVRATAREALVTFGLVLALVLSARVTKAQSGGLVIDPTGGVPPEEVFCPSTGGGCFTSRAAAESAMRAATPNVGHLLVQEPRETPSSTIYYHVPDQAPASYGASLYGIDYNGVIGGDGYCAQSLATSDRPTEWGGSFCYDETEMFNGFVASPKGCGWHSCTYQDYTIVSDYVEPYNSTSGAQYIRWVSSTEYINVNGANEGWLQYSINDKYIHFVEVDHTYPDLRDRTARMVKYRRFVCPQGMTPISTADVTRNPKLCQNSARPYVRIVALRLAKTCPANPQPCHPATGDKSRAETDFTFAGRPFTRHYHSLRETSPSGFHMGDGWTHSFATQMMDPYGSRMLVTSDGYWAPYIPWSHPHWVVPALNNASLDAMQDGSWLLTESNGDVSKFVGGRLMEIRAPGAPDRDVSLEYSANGRLSRLIDNSGRAVNFIYDGTNRLTQVLLPDGITYTYQYDSNGNLVRVVSSAGTQKEYHYGEAGLATNGDPGLLTGITYEDGQRFASFAYDIHGRVLASTLHGEGGQFTETTRIYYNAANAAQVTLSTGAVRTFTYTNDFNRKPLSITDSSGTVTNTYDGYGLLTSHTDSRGIITQNGYTDWRLTSTTNAYGTSSQRTVETDWNTTLNVPTERRVRDASNGLVAKTNWTHNTRGQVLTTTQTDPVNTATRTTTTTYCEQSGVTAGTCPRVGLVLTINGARTDVTDLTSFTYRANDHATCAATPASCPYRKGDLWKVTNGLSHVTETQAYDGAGRPLSVKDPNGVVSEMTYDPHGWLTSHTVKGATSAGDRSTLIDYWPTGLVKRVTQEDGSYTQYGYDVARRLTDISDSTGNTIHYTLDNAGNRTGEKTRDPGGMLARTLSRTFNQLGQLQSQSDAYSHATNYTYDANGNADVITDPLARGTDNAYDPLNRLVQTIQDDGGIAATTQFKYDAQDNLTRVTDPKGLHTDYAYNGLGDLTQLTSPDTGVTTYTYDSAGNRASQTDARLKVQALTYDALNRLTYVTNPNRSYTYDNSNTTICLIDERFGKGRLTGLIDQSGNTKYCYNRFGDLVRKVQTTNSVVLTTRYGYDAAGRLATQTYPDGAVLDAVRDSEGRVVELGVTQNGGTRRVVVTGATYAPFGPNTGWTYGNGRSYLRTLNQNYQPLAIHDAAAGGLSLGFGFDVVGNLTLLQNGARTTNLAQYGYDGLNRLSQVKDGPTGTPIDTYGYDATGNRASVLNAGVTTSYLYSAGNHRLDKVGPVTRTYDASGNTIKIGGNARVLNYDNSGRLASTNANGIRIRNYRYNAKGEQTWSDLAPDYRYFLYDEAGHLLGEYGAAGAPVQQVIWFGDLPVGVLQGAGVSQQLHYVEPDHLGTPRVVIDGTRNVPIWTWGIKGEAFGATPPNQDPDGDSTAFVFDLRYPGQRYDNATGLNYNYFRDYDATTGRYVQSDPIGLRGGAGTYGYVLANPLNKVDPNGLIAFGNSCTAQMRANIIQAVIELSNIITTKAGAATAGCYAGSCDFSLVGDVMRNVASMKFACNYGYLCAQGYVNGLTFYSPIVLTAPKASNVMSPGQCGCLKGLIFHEALHSHPGFDGLSREQEERRVREETLKCVSCAPVRHESGDLVSP